MVLQTLRAGDMQRKIGFCTYVLETDEKIEQFFYCIIFSDEATFNFNGKVDRRNVRIWGLKNPRVVVEHERISPKLNVFHAVFKD